jgi:hemoglobin
MRYWQRTDSAEMDDQEIYNLIGEDGFRRLVAAFYRQVPHDEILGAMYPRDDLAGAEQRLRDFLIFRFGGPQHYIEQRGHPRLRMRHAPFAIGRAARDRWMQLMNSALAEAMLPPEAESVLREFFEGTATFMINRLAWIRHCFRLSARFCAQRSRQSIPLYS